MRIKINKSTLELVEGNITEQSTEAVVNPANRTLLGGGGVDGAIHRAGGPRIMEECRKLGGCDSGDARITTGGNLPSPYVIHTVGPVYRDGRHKEADLLARAYKRSLEVAEENGIRTIAFPSISTGAYGYPLDKAAEIALRTVIDYLKQHSGITLVRFVLYGQKSFKAFSDALGELAESPVEDEPSELVDDDSEE